MLQHRGIQCMAAFLQIMACQFHNYCVFTDPETYVIGLLVFVVVRVEIDMFKTCLVQPAALASTVVPKHHQPWQSIGVVASGLFF